MKKIKSILAVLVKPNFSSFSIITSGSKKLRRKKLAFGILLIAIMGINQSCARTVRHTCYKPAIDPPVQQSDTTKNG